MHKEDTQVLVRALATFTLAGHDLPVIEYRGQPVMFAAKVAEALEYDDPNRLGEFIGGKWAPRFREGTDYVRLTGDDLAALKAVDHPTIRGSVDSRASSVTLLTEAGAQVAAMLSRTKVGDRVRWEIVDTLIPAIRKLAAPIPEPPKQIEGPPAAVMLALAKGGTRIGDVFATSYLAAELARSKAKDRADREARKEREHRDRVALRREREAQRLARRAKKAPPTTLW